MKKEASKTPKEQLKDKLYHLSFSMRKIPFKAEEFKKKAKEIRKTFKQDEPLIQY